MKKVAWQASVFKAAGGAANRGGAGEYGEVRLVRVSGLNTVTIAVGAGGTNTYTQVVGADGVMFIEY